WPGFEPPESSPPPHERATNRDRTAATTRVLSMNCPRSRPGAKPADGVHQVRPGIKREVARDARAQGQVGIPHAPPKRRAHGGGVNVASRLPMGEPWTETKLSVTRTVQVSPGGRGCFRRSQISLCSGN